MSHPSPDTNPHGKPHFHPVARSWAPLAEAVSRQILTWSDTHQLTVFGRHGYYFNNLLFATVPVHEAALELWVRLSEEEATIMGRSPQASLHNHPVKGWMRFRIDHEKQVEEALNWVEKAYRHAQKLWEEGVAATLERSPEGAGRLPLGAPIHLVPEATGKPHHKIPQGPTSSRFITGLPVEGAHPQPLRS